MLIDQSAGLTVSALRLRPLPFLRADTAMYDLLKLFQTGRSHMVVLTQPKGQPEPVVDNDDAASIVSRADTAEVAIQIEEADERVAQEVG